jgi:hypothetical protein
MRTDKLTVGLVGILMVIGAVAILQQRETNAQLRRQMADLYRKSGHTAIAETGDSASAGTIAVSKEGISASDRGELARLRAEVSLLKVHSRPL